MGTGSTDIIRGTADMLILRLLAIQPMHGRGIAPPGRRDRPLAASRARHRTDPRGRVTRSHVGLPEPPRLPGPRHRPPGRRTGSWRYGRLTAVDHVSLAVEKGQVFGSSGRTAAGRPVRGATDLAASATARAPIPVGGGGDGGSEFSITARRVMNATMRIVAPHPGQRSGSTSTICRSVPRAAAREAERERGVAVRHEHGVVRVKRRVGPGQHRLGAIAPE